MRLIYLSHPEVVVDPKVPVPDWGLSPDGRRRLEAVAARGWPKVARIVSSAERKAREAAAILAAPQGFAPIVHAGLGEIDRSATGYVPAARHEALADRLFAEPERSADGWETARAAQGRALDALRQVLAGEGDVLVVGHGGVGTLTWCALSGVPIDRRHDQPGMGFVWQADAPDYRPLGGWRRLEEAIS
jgi:broad specificity phosphatase PhoE